MSSTRSRQWASMWWVCLVALCLAAPIPLAVADHILESEDIIVHVLDQNGVWIETPIWISERALLDSDPVGLVKARSVSFPEIKRRLLARDQDSGAAQGAVGEPRELEVADQQGGPVLRELAGRSRLTLLVSIDRVVSGVFVGAYDKPRPSPLVYLTIEEVLLDRGGPSRWRWNDEPIAAGQTMRVVADYGGCINLETRSVCEVDGQRAPAPEVGRQYVMFGFQDTLGPGFLHLPWAAEVAGGLVSVPGSASPMTLQELRAALRDVGSR